MATSTTKGPAKRGVVLSASVPPELLEEIDAAVEQMDLSYINRSRVASMLLEEFSGRIETSVRGILARSLSQ